MGSRRGSHGSRGLLLDTSFILPILGFEASERVMEAFHRLGGYRIYYSDLSILEALWKIVKVVRGEAGEVERVVEGIEAIREHLNHAPIDGKAVENAVYMYKLGHRDLVDNLLYSIALSRGLRLLTVDGELEAFIEEHGLPRQALATPEEI